MYFKLIKNIHPNREKYSRDLVRVCKLGTRLARRMGDREIYISEFVIAKILGYLKHLPGHPEVTKQFLLKLPQYLNNPKEILMRDDRPKERCIICGNTNHRVVLEIKRDRNKTQINTIHVIKESKLKRFKSKCVSL